LVSLHTEEVALLRFLLGGLTGTAALVLSTKVLEAVDMHVVTPFLFFGFFSLFFMWFTRALYSVAAITMASSEVWQTNLKL